MASYRFSASVISRSTGRSATAAAAYRAADEIACDRYGETHDFTRKQGVTHSEIMAPENAPEWMRDRAQLWNAVEAVERRKDAQLAREVQLSLPHELDDEQRRELVRAFVAREFVARGMVADVNIHAPGREGDDRNHHAHIMLTLRSIEGDGFGKKRREWNDRALIDQWREQWAEDQNRFFEAAGIEARVDHRSFEAQGIDREPQQHEGPAAANMRRKNKDTRIGAENDAREQRNQHRAAEHVAALKELAKVAAERHRFEDWAATRQETLEAAQSHSRLDLEQAQDREAAALEDRLEAVYGQSLRTVQHEAGRIEARLGEKGIIPAFRRVFTGRSERERLDALQATIRDTQIRMQEVRDRLAKEQAIERARVSQLQEQRKQAQHEGIEAARAKKEEALAARVREAQQKAAKGEDERVSSLRQQIERNRAERAEQAQQKDEGRDFEP